jgi:hypothetical protein
MASGKRPQSQRRGLQRIVYLSLTIAQTIPVLRVVPKT